MVIVNLQHWGEPDRPIVVAETMEEAREILDPLKASGECDDGNVHFWERGSDGSFDLKQSE